MAQGAIVGRQGTGLSCFVGTFYAAQVRRTTEGTDPYRFACTTEALAALGPLYNALKGGDWPPALEPQEMGRIAFSMDYPDSLGKRFLPAFGRAKQSKGTPELEMGVRSLPQGPGEPVGPRMVDCRVLVLLAEVPSLNATGAVDIDGEFARALADAERASPQAVVVWWLSKPPKAAKDDKEGRAFPAPTEASARRQLSEDLVGRHLPATAARLAASKTRASSFFAWVDSEKKGDELRVRRRQLFKAGGVEPEYPYEEYLALLDHLGAISA